MSDEDKNLPDLKGNGRDRLLLNLEAALNLIPYAGGFVATYFSEIRQERATEKMQTYFDYFRKRLEDIDEEKVDKNFLQSEKFAELFLQGAEYAAKSTLDRKIYRLANILLNQAQTDFSFRNRTQSLMQIVDRLSDLDVVTLTSYGPTFQNSFTPKSKKEAYEMVSSLTKYIGIEEPTKDDIFESIIYLDNLGLTWVNELESKRKLKGDTHLILGDFSSFRTPFGKEVTKTILPPDFFSQNDNKKLWPNSYINSRYVRNGYKP